MLLLFLLSYTYALLFVAPYIGFQFGSRGDVIDIFVSLQDTAGLRLEDRIISIDDLTWEGYRTDSHAVFLQDAAPKDKVSIVLERNGQQERIVWIVPGFNEAEFYSRLVNTWPISYVFWLAGSATLILVRPRGKRRNLLVAMNYITAIWLMAGALSQRHIWEASFVMRASLWLTLPIYLHLHWNFPREFRPLPKASWPLLYAFAAWGAAMEWFQLLPRDPYYWPFLLALAGSVLILALHYFLRPEERSEVALLVLAAGFAFAPTFAIALQSAQDSLSSILPGLLFALLALPGAYFYVLYRRQLAGLELRANRIISLYLYLLLLLTLIFILLPALPGQFFSPEDSTGAIVLLVLLTSVVTALGFNRFQRLVERYVLRMPVPPEHLLAVFARKISTSITAKHLTGVLLDEVLPSLLVRQSLLAQADERGKVEVFFSRGLEASEMPMERELSELLKRDRNLTIVAQNNSKSSTRLDWIRLSLPLTVGEKNRGVWLFGQRDPDDYYSQAEIAVLTALADQTAIALTNIAQAKRLRAFYQRDIDRQEDERAGLARELHDAVLNRFAEIVVQVGEKANSEEFNKSYQSLADGLRATIHTLRPPMLNYGLHAALQELSGDLVQLSAKNVKIDFQIPKTNTRFDPRVEQHLFRIVQQAVENALRHAQAQQISISGQIEPDEIEIQVRDDGRGFKLNGHLDLVQLIEERHFGLAGMNERAALVGADLEIDTAPRKGCTIWLRWSRKELPE